MEYSEDFKRFLKDETLYRANQEFWRYAIADIAKTKLSEWVKNEYGNGDEIRDGNPLFSARVANNKAIRIIQSSRDALKPVWASWNNTYRIEDHELHELVVALQPFKYTYDDALRLVERFIAGGYLELQVELNLRYDLPQQRNEA